jgi:hypothetical protein
MKNQI